jgi:hypothetical protein
MSTTKAVIITRDRPTYTKLCLARLLACPDVGDVHVVDHGSIGEPMLALLASIAGPVGSSERRVHVHWKPNAHPRDLWTNGTLESIVKPGERFLVTDCDVMAPGDWRGQDWLKHLHRLLDAFPHVVKAGLQLSLAIPVAHPQREEIMQWEANYRRADQLRRIPGALMGDPAYCYEASVDTTLALYRDLGPYALDPALRTAYTDFEAKHLPWSEWALDPLIAEELAFYEEHAEHGHWRTPAGFSDSHGLTS